MEEPKSKAKRGAKTAAAAQEDKITLLPLSELHDFPNHPFKVRDDEAMLETAESIRQYGVLVPAIVRPREDGGYEIVAGHRRKHGSELAGLQNLPCIVREMDDDTATILMVDSNIQRENILPSERAQAYKMKLEAIRRKAGRPAKTEEIDASENGGQNGHDLRGIKSRELLAENSDDSARTIQRYIRLTELSPELQQMVDEKKIGPCRGNLLPQAGGTADATHRHRQRAGHTLALTGAADEEALPRGKAQRRFHAGHYDGAEKAGGV